MLVQAKILKGNLRLLDTVLEKTARQQTQGKLSGREEGGCGQYISDNEGIALYSSKK